MQKYNGQLIRQFASSVSGNAASGVTVTVRRQSDSGLATLYVDNNIAGATLPNPITSSSTGHFSFYAPDDVYTLTFSDTTPVQVIQLQDVAELQAQFDSAVLNAGYIPSGINPNWRWRLDCS
jgi:4-alpha-glucanotransferase